MTRHVSLWLAALFVAGCGLRASATAPPGRPPAATPATVVASAAPAPSDAAAAAGVGTEGGEAGFRLTAADVEFQPGPDHYSGDLLSLVVVAEDAPRSWQGAPVTVYLPGEIAPLARANFAAFGLGGRNQATFTWVWDTAGLVGPQAVRVVVTPTVAGVLQPVGVAVTATVDLLPAALRPEPEASARWAQAESDCCVFHYLTGTAAERDLDSIRAEADAAFQHVEAVLGVAPQRKVVFNLLSRLLGHGGFASGEVSVAYLDRNPATSTLFNLFAHEGTHILDRQLARTRPAMFTEGMAVFVAGGHFKPESLDRRVAALLDVGDYIPLATLADNFYPSQHEAGYLEAGAFIQYLVERFGWLEVKDLYGSFQVAPTDRQMLEAGLRARFGLGLDELEAGWLRQLRALPLDAQTERDLQLTMALYDTLRRYQAAADPAAYFLHAWLPDAAEARRRGIVADYVRQPRSPENIALETLLVGAGQALDAGDFAQAQQLLDAANAALDAGTPAADPLAAQYLQVAAQLAQVGYQAQRITLGGGSGAAEAIRDWPHVEEVALAPGPRGWALDSPELDSRVVLGDGIILRRLYSRRAYGN